MVSRGILSLILPPLKTGRATFTASGFQKSRLLPGYEFAGGSRGGGILGFYTCLYLLVTEGFDDGYVTPHH